MPKKVKVGFFHKGTNKPFYWTNATEVIKRIMTTYTAYTNKRLLDKAGQVIATNLRDAILSGELDTVPLKQDSIESEAVQVATAGANPSDPYVFTKQFADSITYEITGVSAVEGGVGITVSARSKQMEGRGLGRKMSNWALYKILSRGIVITISDPVKLRKMRAWLAANFPDKFEARKGEGGSITIKIPARPLLSASVEKKLIKLVEDAFFEAWNLRFKLMAKTLKRYHPPSKVRRVGSQAVKITDRVFDRKTK